MSPSRAHPASDHHAPVAFGTASPAWVEPLGHATQLRAPGHVLVEALLGLLGDADARAPGLLTESRDAARRRAFLLLGRRARCGPHVRQRSEDHYLVVLDADLHSREPAVWESSGKPTFDRSELFFIHDYKITT